MARRHAILPDNDEVLEARIAALRAELPGLIGERACAAMVIGSVADGRAHDRSDIDVLLVLRDGSPRRSDYAWWDAVIAPRLVTPDARFPVSPVFVGRTALATAEPHLRRAIDTGIALWDPEGVFDDQSEPRT
jgi:hypothetical protein